MFMNRPVQVLLAFVLCLFGCSWNVARGPVNSPGNTGAVSESRTNESVEPNPEPAPSRSTGQPDLESQRSALLETDLNFSSMSEEKGAALAFYEFLMPDGVTLFAGEPPIRGRDAIKVHLAAGPQGFLTWQPTSTDVAQSGDLGFTWGTALFQTKGADEKPRINYSKYVSIWKKQRDGSWKVALFSTTPSPPPTERRQ